MSFQDFGGKSTAQRRSGAGTGSSSSRPAAIPEASSWSSGFGGLSSSSAGGVGGGGSSGSSSVAQISESLTQYQVCALYS
jgi:hypothetical protein